MTLTADEIDFKKRYESELNGRSDNDDKIFKLVETSCDEKLLEFIKEEMRDAGWCYDYQIVETPKGKKENDVEFEVYINQTTNGGYSGDEYSGELYFKLPNGKYFMCFYDMS